MSTTALVLTATVCVGLYVVLRPRKATQSEYMRGMTDAQAMVESRLAMGA